MSNRRNAVVGQSGGPTAAINATLAGVISGVLSQGENGHINTLYGMFNGVEGLLRGDLCDLTKRFETTEDLDALIHTPAAALGSCRKKLPVDPADTLYDQLFSRFAEFDIGYFFYIGGNDSMDTVAKLTKAAELRGEEMQFIGVPKTIDNDLEGTDHTPGYGSAAKFIATTVQEIIRDCSVYTVPAVTIVEIMGRDAGWLTAAAALPALVWGEGPDLIYVPERVFSMEDFLKDVRKALEKHPNVVVAVSEGICNADGEYVGSLGQSGSVDAFGHKYLAGTGKVLENTVKREIGCKVRSIELSLPQRCAAHLASKTDLEESVRVGRGAVNAANNGKTGCVMTMQREEGNAYAISISSANVQDVANQIRTLPEEFITPEGNQITKEGAAYILPLIQGEVSPKYENGLPYHLKLRCRICVLLKNKTDKMIKTRWTFHRVFFFDMG